MSHTTSPTRAERRRLVAAIKKAVEAKLPEDEPDCVRTWVYETAVDVVVGALRAAPSPGDALRQQIEALGRLERPDKPYSWGYSDAIRDVLALLSRGAGQ